MNNSDKKVIAVDFDGTIVEDKYPKIGKAMPFAFETLKILEKEGHRLILWTYRKEQELQDAVDFCKENGLEFYAVNKSFPEEVFTESTRRKLHVDLFIDDKNLGGFPGWGQVYQMLKNESTPGLSKEKSKKKGLLSIFK
jgi:2-hydroxy-3-keto-5-methylthiopentenyl-1-phosphate phosphatase